MFFAETYPGLFKRYIQNGYMAPQRYGEGTYARDSEPSLQTMRGFPFPINYSSGVEIARGI